MDSNQYYMPPAGDYNHCCCYLSGSRTQQQTEVASSVGIASMIDIKNTSLSGINPISERLEMPSTIDPEDKIREYYTK